MRNLRPSSMKETFFLSLLEEKEIGLGIRLIQKIIAINCSHDDWSILGVDTFRVYLLTIFFFK